MAPLLILISTLAIPGVATLDSDKEDMADIIDNVRANEELYRNLEVKVRRVYQLEQPELKLPIASAGRDTTDRTILQKGLFYFNRKDVYRTQEGNETDYPSLAGYDGEMTRSLKQEKVAHIRDDRNEPYEMFKPTPAFSFWHACFSPCPLIWKEANSSRIINITKIGT